MNKLFTAVCLVAAAYFCWSFHTIAGFPPKQILDEGVFIYIILFAFFILLPFAQTLEIGSFFKYSAKIEAIKSEVKEFKEETRSLIALQNSLISNVSQTVSHNVNVTIPSLTQARLAEEKLTEVEQEQKKLDERPNSAAQEDAIRTYVVNAGGDINFAIMLLRRDLEIELRRILGKTIGAQPTIGYQTDKKQFFSLVSLWRMFVERFPEHLNSSQALTYVVDVCNAVIHGQTVSPEIAEEALSMGLRIQDLLRSR